MSDCKSNIPPSPNVKGGNVKAELDENIGNRIVAHRDRFRRLFLSRMYELLPHLITYRSNITTVDWLQVELDLREGNNVVLLMLETGNIVHAGYCNYHNRASRYTRKELTKNDITFIIDETYIPLYVTEIQRFDNCASGNFVVLQNKTYQIGNDYEIINHYADELAEIVTTRFSVSMQGKILTMFMSDVSDESINQFITKLYNGHPFAKVSKSFDFDNIKALESNANIPSLLQEFKKEYQNKIAELITYFGVDSIGVDKESGVSKQEVNSNNAYVNINANIYIQSRNEPLQRLNKRYDVDIEAIINDRVITNNDFFAGEKNE